MMPPETLIIWLVRSGFLCCLHIHRANNILDTSAAALRAFLSMFVVFTYRFRQFEAVSTFFAFEFIDWHGQPPDETTPV